jgi:AraC family transcriptional regulator of adaptative response/methylated-DNA-[protein]-cysteine methyltransferase
LENRRDSLVTLDELAKALGSSSFYIQRAFKATLGVTPRQYSERLLTMNAKSLLRGGQSVRRSTYSSGHNSTSWLYARGQAKFGMRPGEYKNGGSGKTILYAITRCGLGWVLVGGTEKGIRTVSLGKSDEELRCYLAMEFSRAVLIMDESKLTSCLTRILQYIDGDSETNLSDLPIDVRATSFQARVWKELQRIPYGRTRTYGEVARRVGSPSAVRAVANGCAKNPVALVVPCHHVIRKDGGLGGYRWGLERKEALLAKESERAKVSKFAVSS